jgi:hypothetical protein
MPFTPSKTPETYSALFKRSFLLYRYVLKSTLIFAILVATILYLPQLIADAAGQGAAVTSMTQNREVILNIAMYVSFLWFLAAILWCINCIERKKHKNFIDDIEMAGKRILYVLGAAILIFLIGSVAGFISYLLYTIFNYLDLYSYNKYISACLWFIVLGAQVGFSVCVAMLFYFYFPLIVIENDGIFLALKTSVNLVRGRIWRTLCLQLTPWVFYFLTILIIKVVFQINLHIYFLPSDQPTLYITVLNILLLAFFIPWGSAMTLVQLRDLELRKAAASKKK